MKVVMRGSISGHAVDSDGKRTPGPKVGDVLDVSDEQGKTWIEQGMAFLHEEKPVETADDKRPVETTAVSTTTAPARRAKGDS